jgi:hypothetical protein
MGSLGERFGSAGATAEANLRAQLENNASLNRANIQFGATEANKNRQQGAATQLEQGGLNESNQMLQFFQQLMGGTQALGGMETGRNNMNLQLLQMMAGLGGGGSTAGNTVGGVGQTGGDLSQLMFMLPLLQQMMGGKAGASGGRSGGGGGETADWMSLLNNWGG